MPTNKENFINKLNTLADAVKTKRPLAEGTDYTINNIVDAISSWELRRAEESPTVDLDLSNGNQVIIPTVSGNVLSQVTIRQPVDQEGHNIFISDNIRSGITLGNVTGTYTAVNENAVTAADIRFNKKAFVNGSDVITGSMSDYSGTTLIVPTFTNGTPSQSSTSHIATQNTFVTSNINYANIWYSNLDPTKILNGETVNIGTTDDISTPKVTVTGTYTPAVETLILDQPNEPGGLKLNYQNTVGYDLPVQILTHSQGKLIEQVILYRPENLIPENIKYNIPIAGTAGTFTSSSTVSSGQIAATADKIRSGYSAWVNGTEIQGSIPNKSAEVYNPTIASSSSGTATLNPITISSGQYLTGNQTITATEVRGLNPEYIVSGHSIQIGYTQNDTFRPIHTTQGSYTGIASEYIEPTAIEFNELIFRTTTSGITIDSDVVVNPEPGHAFSQVKIKRPTDMSAVAAKIAYNQTIHGISGTFSYEANNSITASSIRNGKVGFVNGNKIIGTMLERDVGNIGLSTTDYTIAANQYLAGAQTIYGARITTTDTGGTIAVNDFNALAGLLVKDVTLDIGDTGDTDRLAHIVGTYDNQKPEEVGNVTLNFWDSTHSTYYDQLDINPSTQNTVFSHVLINKPATLIKGNIASGVSIAGVTGTYTNDANATSSDIYPGKTAYVQGTKVSGSMQTRAAATIYPSASDQTIASGRYLTGTQTIKATTVKAYDPVLQETVPLDPDYIIKGVVVKVGDEVNNARVASITGTFDYTEFIEGPREVDLSLASGNQTINPEATGYSMSQIIIKKPVNLLASNIKKDVEIAGITGTFEEIKVLEIDANYNSASTINLTTAQKNVFTSLALGSTIKLKFTQSNSIKYFTKTYSSTSGSETFIVLTAPISNDFEWSNTKYIRTKTELCYIAIANNTAELHLVYKQGSSAALLGEIRPNTDLVLDPSTETRIYDYTDATIGIPTSLTVTGLAYTAVQPEQLLQGTTLNIGTAADPDAVYTVTGTAISEYDLYSLLNNAKWGNSGDLAGTTVLFSNTPELTNIGTKAVTFTAGSDNYTSLTINNNEIKYNDTRVYGEAE